jgi:hypothetical protein
MLGIYTYIPETNYVPRKHLVAANMVLLFMVFISLVLALTPLYLYVSTFRSMCAVPNMAVFCSSLTSQFPSMLLTYFLNDFEIVLLLFVVVVVVVCCTHERIISLLSIIVRILRRRWSMYTPKCELSVCILFR